MTKAEIIPRKCNLKIAFIVADDTSLDPDTEAIIVDRLHGRVADVDLYHEDDIDAGNANLNKYDLVLASKQITDDSKVNELTYLEVPVISFKATLSCSILGIGTVVAAGIIPGTNTNITDKTHNITRERDLGPQSIYKTSSLIEFIGGISLNALSLAEDPLDINKKHLVIAEAGEWVNIYELGFLRYEGLRIHFGYSQINQLNAIGQSLFDETIGYALCKSAFEYRGYFTELLGLSNDMTKLDITTTARDLDIVPSNQRSPSPTITDDKKVRKVMLIVECWVNNASVESPLQNCIDCTNPSHNQWQANLDGGSYVDLEPHGQMEDGDWTLYTPQSHLYQKLIFDVTDLIRNIDGNIGVRLQNARARLNILELTCTVALSVTYKI
jgi:hypothetical protein